MIPREHRNPKKVMSQLEHLKNPRGIRNPTGLPVQLKLEDKVRRLTSLGHHPALGMKLQLRQIHHQSKHPTFHKFQK